MSGTQRGGCAAAVLVVAAAALLLAGAPADAHPSGGSAPQAAALVVNAYGPKAPVRPGSVAIFRVRLGRRAALIRPPSEGHPVLPALVGLRIAAPMPSGITAKLDARATRSTTTRLVVRVGRRVRPGTYRLHLSAEGRLDPAVLNPPRFADTDVTVVVVAAAVSGVTITGVPARAFAPGTSVPVDIVFTNHSSHVRSLTGLTMRVLRIAAPRADAKHPCTTADFTVRQLPTAATLQLQPHSRRDLTALGFATVRWPRLVMIDRPVNQDGCKRATVTLGFEGITP
jgi:hypothetical protein